MPSQVRIGKVATEPKEWPDNIDSEDENTILRLTQ